MSTAALLLLLLLFPPYPTAAADNCDGRRIHVRSLPPQFNVDLLRNCSTYPIYGDLCPSLPNHGLGPKTHPSSHSWYLTHPHLLDLLFHRRLLDYPCLSPDPAAADAVFLPFYAALAALPFLYGPAVNSSAHHGLDLLAFLDSDHPGIWSRRGGHDHFLVLSRPAWDFSQPPDADPPTWGTSFLHLPPFFNLTALTLESRAWPWQEQAVPYPTSFHPATPARLANWVARARRSPRRTLMLFAGGGGSSPAANIRYSIRAQCENRTDLCDLVDCSGGACEREPGRYLRPMLRAQFCLQPPGDTPTRRSTFDAILAGCIPVFFEEMSARRQYGWHLPPADYLEFSVLIPKEDVVFNGVSIAGVLSAIPPEKVRRMRERVLELVPRVTYRRHGAPAGIWEEKDAFDLAIDGVLARIKRRLAGSD